MIVAEKVTDKLRQLPTAAQEEVLDFVEFLLQKNERGENVRLSETPQQKAAAIEKWAQSHSPETPVIIDDRREIIYED